MSGNPNTITKTSGDGIKYQTLDTGSSVTLNYEDSSEHSNLSTIGGFNVHHVYITCEELKNKLLPAEANPREPSHSAVVEEMQRTLVNQPEKFVRWNNGITVVCESVTQDRSKSEVTIEFSDADEGICNGGHTYFSIVTSDGTLDDAGVQLEVVEVPNSLGTQDRQEEIVEIARKRNNINNLDEHSISDFLDLYDVFKEPMDDERVVEWHENDSQAHDYAIGAKDLIRILAALDPDRFHHGVVKPNNKTHAKTATAKGSIHSQWFEGAMEARSKGGNPPMHYMAVLIDDIFEIRDMLSYSLKHESFSSGIKRTNFFEENIGGDNATVRDIHHGKYAGKDGYKLKKALELMLLGAFRSDIFLDLDQSHDPRYIGWVEAPDELWADEKERVLDELESRYKSVNSSFRDMKNKSISYEVEMFKWGRNPSWPNPPAETLYDIDTYEVFKSVDDVSDATHWLDPGGQGLVKKSNQAPSSNAPLYKSV